MPVNITVYSDLSPGRAHAAHGCLKHTLNVVIKAQSCGTCGRVSLFFYYGRIGNRSSVVLH